MIYYTDRGEAKILDVACGSKMFWYDKNNKNTLYVDKRMVLNEKLCDGRNLTICPDKIASFTELPFCNNSFNLVVFDPPHLKRAGKTSWLAKKIRSIAGRLANMPAGWLCGMFPRFKAFRRAGV